ncbi:MAG TPA: MBL fold metallo-hydrolase [Candidatus Baltobacteraceae bacterium]|nr:MBL fold metallo-hydrolase [Candidatus Baltobacteraceae bacterium]
MPQPVAVPSTTALGDGIVQIRLPMTGNPLRHVNAYAISDDDGLTLVDCGWKAGDVEEALDEGLAEHGFALQDVRRIAITHVHHDHYGLAGTLRARGVPELLVHERDWEFAQALRDVRAADRAADAWLGRNGYAVEPSDEDPEWHVKSDFAPPTRTLRDGDFVGTRLRALWTPGHSPGHCCFVDVRTNRLLTGDHILEPITPHVGRWRDGDRDQMGEYVASLRTAGAAGASAALPAHGEPFPHLARRIDELLAHSAAREHEVLAALDGERASAGTIARRLRWTRRERPFDELSPDHQQFAVAETIAHLHHLAVRRVVGADESGATILYFVR